MGFPDVLRELDPNCTSGPEVRASKRPRISTSDLAKVGQRAGLVTSLWQTDSAGWGRRLSALIEDVWKVEALVQLLGQTPGAGDRRICDCVRAIDEGLEACNAPDLSMSSNEVLAARLVLDTLDGLSGMCREGFREFSERAGTSACLAPILQNIYGAQLLCSLEDADFHSSLRAIMFGGTFRQVALLRGTLSVLLGDSITLGNCLRRLNCAFSCNDAHLYQKAETFYLSSGLGRVIDSGNQAWSLSSLEVVLQTLQKASKSGKDSPYELFLHAGSWIESSVHCSKEGPDAVAGIVEALLVHIDVPRMSLSELRRLLDFSPLVQKYRKCTELLAGAYLHICTGGCTAGCTV
ncbi:hypothetical protein HKI87_01g06380 [Chloropicon roscoffensis]|uniref:Wings apart-like protein C-terminal domain-containing protein n=2 Tax=Chloropicon roscoffensis TaxID=1461544 RepID=A0AAX4NZL1_9CHLO